MSQPLPSNFYNATVRIVIGLLLGAAATFGVSNATARTMWDNGSQASVSLFSPAQQRNTFDACSSLFPAATPIDLEDLPQTYRALALCSNTFAVLYSQTTKTPIVVAERLTAEQIRSAIGGQRTDNFFEDTRIPRSGRATLSDYANAISPVDRGHMSPAGNAPDSLAMEQSFALSNMIPQDPANNRGPWSKIESDVRKFVLRAQGPVYVMTGPLFDAGYETIGKNKVWVPTRIFKLIYDESSQRAWAYVVPNSKTQVPRPIDYDTFVKQTGMQLLKHVPVRGSIAGG